MTLNLIKAGALPFPDSQLSYHAMARLGIQGLLLHSTSDRFLCLGSANDPKDELDLEFCKANDINIFRRDIGGGTVLLAPGQLFYTIVLDRSHPLMPRGQYAIFRKFLEPVVEALSSLGVNAYIRPTSDIVVNGRKLGGNGGGEIGECVVVAGGILLELDIELLSKCIQSPNEQFRLALLEGMRNGVTTFSSLPEDKPTMMELEDTLAKSFQKLMGPMTEMKLQGAITERMAELAPHYLAQETMFRKGMKVNGRVVKIREGHHMIKRELPMILTNTTSITQLGVQFEWKDGRLTGVVFDSPELQKHSAPLNGLIMERIQITDACRKLLTGVKLMNKPSIDAEVELPLASAFADVFILGLET